VPYYSKKFGDKKDIVEVTNMFLSMMNELVIDNMLFADVWGGVIYLLEYGKQYWMSDLDNIQDASEDQLKAIFGVLNCTLGYYENKDEKKAEMESVPLIKVNRNLFNSIITCLD